MSLQIGKALLTCQARAHDMGPWSSSSVSFTDVKGFLGTHRIPDAVLPLVAEAASNSLEKRVVWCCEHEGEDQMSLAKLRHKEQPCQQ